MKLVLVSGIGLTPDLQLEARHGRLLHGRAVATTASAVREREVVLRLVNATFGPAPYGVLLEGLGTGAKEHRARASADPDAWSPGGPR